MNQYDAQQQNTPSSGLHYILYVDGEQAQRLGSSTCMTHTGIKNAMDVKVKQGLYNCQPTNIDGNGKYRLDIHVNY